jgi:hypothetical protein
MVKINCTTPGKFSTISLELSTKPMQKLGTNGSFEFFIQLLAIQLNSASDIDGHADSLALSIPFSSFLLRLQKPHQLASYLGN